MIKEPKKVQTVDIVLIIEAFGDGIRSGDFFLRMNLDDVVRSSMASTKLYKIDCCNFREGYMMSAMNIQLILYG